MERQISILGSCVSRDPFNYCADPPKINYIARQSLATLFSYPLHDSQRIIPTISAEAKGFERRNLEHDFNKNVFASLPTEIPLIIDLIDERHELIELEDGCLYTNSVIASQYSNLAALAKRKINPLGQERMDLMWDALPKFVGYLRRFDKVVLHRASIKIIKVSG